jgi:ABC-2 type transport system permease protein
MDPRQLSLEVATAMQVGQNRLKVRIEDLQRERDQAMARIERDLTLEVRRVQDTYKLAAIALPPIPPLLVGLFVFVRRRSLETLGVPTTRLRGGATGAET